MPYPLLNPQPQPPLHPRYLESVKHLYPIR
jgi:hypothetical protein